MAKIQLEMLPYRHTHTQANKTLVHMYAIYKRVDVDDDDNEKFAM